MACPSCEGSDFQSFTVPINRHTGAKPEGMGSLVGGIALAIFGLAMVWGGFQLNRDPDPTGPAWWQVMGFGAVALSWAGILVQPFAKMDRIGLVKYRCSDCGRRWNRLEDEGSGPGAKPILEALKSDDAEARNEAVMALGNIGYLEFKDPLLKALEDDSDDVRSSAATALGRLSLRSTIEPLLAMLEDQAKHVRSSAAQALAQLGEPEVVLPIIEASQNAGWMHEDNFRQALASIRNPKAIEALNEAKAHDDPFVKDAAEKALKVINEERAKRLYTEEKES